MGMRLLLQIYASMALPMVQKQNSPCTLYNYNNKMPKFTSVIHYTLVQIAIN